MGHKNPLPTILTFIPIRNPVENPVFDSRRGAIKMRHALGLLQCIALHNLRRAGVSRKVGIKYSFKMQHATLWHDALLYHHPSIRNHPPPTHLIAGVANANVTEPRRHLHADDRTPLDVHWPSGGESKS